MDPVARFTRLVDEHDGAPVEEGALIIAAQLDPTVDVDEQLRRLDRLATEVREPTLDGVRRLLFTDLALVGDRESYYDPRNSMLPSVLDRRKGIPITLSVLVMAIGRRVGAPVDGVGLPGHFILRDRVDPTVFIDAFSGGRELDRAACERLVPQQPFDPDWLEPVAERDVLWRMLNNLRHIYATEQRDQLTRVLELARVLSPDGATAYAAVLTAQGRFDLAADVYDTIGEGDRANALRARLN